jgi:hypothetical protein
MNQVVRDRDLRIASVPGLLFLAILWVGCPAGLFAQITKATASVNGTLSDPSGAAVPGATVTLSNVQTGVKWTMKTNDSGDYVILQVPPGQYTMEVSKEGFQTLRQEAFPLEVNSSATFNLVLPVGTPMQSVTVRAGGVHIDSTSSALGTVTEEKEVNNLPLNGRNFTMLLTLSPGASPINTDQNGGGWGVSPVGAISFPAVNGQTNRSNMFWVDGVNDYGSFLSTYAIAPVLDDISEFKDVNQSDQAQFGGVTGAMADVVTKSGTNQYHGSAWDFIENGDFDASNFFLPSVGKFTSNMFGATVGGPLIIPHLYNGRNKTFVFLAYEGFRKTAPAQSLYVVPTPAELLGNLNDPFNPGPIYNPYTTQADPNNPGQFTRQVFQNNQIPQNLIDPKMVLYAQTIFPQPIDTGISAGAGLPNFNGLDTSPIHTSQDEGTLRVDEDLGNTDRLFARWTGTTQAITGSNGFAGFKNFQNTHGDNIAAGWTHTFGPTALLTFGYGRTMSDNIFLGRFVNVNAANFVQQIGFQPVQYTFPGHTFIPGLGIPGYATGGEGFDSLHAADGNEWKVDFSKVSGKHTIGAGADFAQNKLVFPCFFTGESFCPFQTSNLETGVGGSGLASFLLGLPNEAGLGIAPVDNTGGWVDGFYIQDQWKATERLTLNLGLRYDMPINSEVGQASDHSTEVGNWDFNTGNYVLQVPVPSCSVTGALPCIPGGVLPAHVVVQPHPGQSLVNSPRDNWGPRVGLAYRLSTKTALRTAYGRFFDTWASVTQNQLNYSFSWPDQLNISTPPVNQAVPDTHAEAPFPSRNFDLPAANPYFNQVHFSDPNAKDALSDQWHAQVQRELPGDMVLAAAYVGSHTIRIPLFFPANVPATPGPGNPMDSAPFPYAVAQPYLKTIGKSNYNALQISLKRQSSRGLVFQLSYTYSKAMDFGCDGNFGNSACGVQDPNHWQTNTYGVAGFDQTHNLTVSWVWPLPFGPGTKWAADRGALSWVVGGWQLNGIGTLASGVPYDVSASGDIPNLGISTGERVNITGNPYAATNSLQPINPAAFSSPLPFTFGDLGRNTFRGPAYRNLDLSVFRQFPLPLGESSKLEFRFEAFNAFNNVVFGLPDRFIGDPTFGQVASTQNNPRQLQLALKLYF